MFPTLSSLIDYFTGFNLPLPIQTFGFFMALAFAAAYFLTSEELKRKTDQGLVPLVPITVTKFKSVTASAYITNAILNGIIGFKLVEAILDYHALVDNPQLFILSTKGSLWGLLGGVVLGLVNTYRDALKLRGTSPETSIREVPAHELMWNITAIAGISGLIGAKLFHNLEYIDDLMNDPINSLLSFSGLTFYGGLIVATIAVLYYTNKKGIPTMHMIDAAAPALMMAYCIGRIGCHLSGDGDWGIVNLAPKPDWLGFLPNWVWSYTYPHNVIGEGVQIAKCTGPHCFELPQGVYPTPFYEVIMALGLFGLLWNLRTKITKPGVLFGVYLIVNGIERFLIEQIRVNSTYNIFGNKITQAELIAAFLVLAGLIFIVKQNNKQHEVITKSKNNS